MQLSEPLVLPADAHPLNEKVISRNALNVLRRLQEADHSAFLVGGGVRDVLVGEQPKDFDVATDASPEQVRALFRNSRIIGRRFRLVHVVFGRDVIEVATFRADHGKGEGGKVGESGRIVRDNVYGTIEEDAIRRDFAVNALYYNIADGCVIDFVGGLEDIDGRVLKLIGDPVTRCEEDPVRVIRAARLAAKLDFAIDPATEAAMKQTAAQLHDVPPARLFEEMLKMFQGGYAVKSFRALRKQDLLQYLFPTLNENLAQDTEERISAMLEFALDNTDKRVAMGKPVTPYYLLAFMLWPEVEAATLHYMAEGESVGDALHRAGGEVIQEQLPVLAIPQRLRGSMREIWEMQGTLEALRGERNHKLLDSRRFRAAYDFLCLRARDEPALEAMAKFWTDVQELEGEARNAAIAAKPPAPAVWRPRLEGTPVNPEVQTATAAEEAEHPTRYALGEGADERSHHARRGGAQRRGRPRRDDNRGNRESDGNRNSEEPRAKSRGKGGDGNGESAAGKGTRRRNNRSRNSARSNTARRQRNDNPGQGSRAIEDAGGARLAPFGGGADTAASTSAGGAGPRRRKRSGGRGSKRTSSDQGGGKRSNLPRDEHGDVNGNR